MTKGVMAKRQIGIQTMIIDNLYDSVIIFFNLINIFCNFVYKDIRKINQTLY